MYTLKTNFFRLCLLAGIALLASAAMTQGKSTPAAAPPPFQGITLIDTLKVEGDALRTIPAAPQYGAWGIMVGQPRAVNALKMGQTHGVLIEKQGQGIVYPTTGMFGGAAGTLEFDILTTAPSDAANTTVRSLLDSWSTAGPSRLALKLVGTKLTFTLQDDKNQTKTIDTDVNWGGGPGMHKITILWDANDLTLLVDEGFRGKIDKPAMPAASPLGIVLGNNRDFNQFANLGVLDLRCSNVREQNASKAATPEAGLTDNDLNRRVASAYVKGLYPLIEQVKRTSPNDAAFFYALAYKDIHDIEMAKRAIMPLTADQNNPLYVPAVFLWSDLLEEEKDYYHANEALQLLTDSKMVDVSVKAQIRQAIMLAEQGNKTDAMAILGKISARYANNPAVNSIYVYIAQQMIDTGKFDKAKKACDMIGLADAPDRKTASVGVPFLLEVAGADMNIKVSDAGVPVTVTATSGDKKTFTLKPAFSRGVYVGTIDIALGAPKPDDPSVLYVQGNDKLNCVYTELITEDGVAAPRSINVNLATDAHIMVIAQSALDVYNEAQKLVKKNILSDDWELVGTLPKSCSSFFRNPDDGTLRKKPWHFSKAFLYTIKPGQGIYIELNSPNDDKTADVDTVNVDLSTQGGKTLKVALKETGPHTGIFTANVKTTPVGQAQPDMLEVSMNDTVTAAYTNENPAENSMSLGKKIFVPVKDANGVDVKDDKGNTVTKTEIIESSRISIRTVDGKITCGMIFDDDTQGGDERHQVFMRMYRMPAKAAVIVQVEDRDLDVTDQPDKVTVKVHTAGGVDLPLTLTETDSHTGIFSGTLNTAVDGVAPVLKVKPGELVTVTYTDEENSTGKSVDRTFDYTVNAPESASFFFKRQIVQQPKVSKTDKLAVVPPPIITWVETTKLVPGSDYMVTLVDPTLIPTTVGELWTNIKLKSSNNAVADVSLHGQLDDKSKQIIYTGQFYVRLGDPSSPVKAYFSQTGALVEMNDEDEATHGFWSIPAINVQGKDKVLATYTQPSGVDGKKNVPVTRSLTVNADAEIAVLDMQGNPLELLKPGMPFELDVNDPSGDLTVKRDSLKATLESSSGDKKTVDLLETDLHSGIFSTIVNTEFGTAPKVGDTLEVPFDGKITITYHDEQTIDGPAKDITAVLTTRPMAEADAVMLTKVFDDPKFEMETTVREGESLYAVGAAELALSKVPKDQARINPHLEESARLLQQVIDRFPNSEYVVECLYLTGKIMVTEQRYDDAAKLFNRVIDEFPDSEFVPQALYELVMLYYDQATRARDKKDEAAATQFIENSTEAAMKLVYGYPKNPLVADSILRISEWYYSSKDYMTAAYIYKRILDRFPDNPKADLISYRLATAYYKAGFAGDQTALELAIRSYLEFVKTYKDHELAPDALYWAAKAYLKQNNVKKAYTLLTKLLLTYQNTDMKAYAQKERDTIKENYPGIEADSDF